jgi:hypothetical protein
MRGAVPLQGGWGVPQPGHPWDLNRLHRPATAPIPHPRLSARRPKPILPTGATRRGGAVPMPGDAGTHPRRPCTHGLL